MGDRRLGIECTDGGSRAAVLVCVRIISDVLSRVRVGLPGRAGRLGSDSVRPLILLGELVKVGAAMVEAPLRVSVQADSLVGDTVLVGCFELDANVCEAAGVDIGGGG